MPTNLDHFTTSSGPTPPKRTMGHDSQIPAFLRAKTDPQDAVSDEEQAVRSLDDTIMRPAPLRDTLWTEEARAQAEPTRAQTSSRRVPTGVLMCAVAVVSFVAGGVVARLSSQMPVLFAEQPAATETVAAYHPSEQEDETTQTEVTQTPKEQEAPESVTASPSYDTGDDTTDDSTSRETDNTAWQWNFDENGDESITYQPETDEVTIDYDGYSLTVPIGELIGNRTELTELYSQQDTGERTWNDRSWTDGTGYDTEEDRDWYVRHDGSSRTYGWS